MLVIYYRSKRVFGDLETFVTGELFHVQKRNLICFSWKKNMAWEVKHTKVKWLVPYFVHFNWSFFEILLTFISPKPSPKPSDVQLLSSFLNMKVGIFIIFFLQILPKWIPLKIATSRLDYQLFASFRYSLSKIWW
jgi:hypothetical protein